MIDEIFCYIELFEEIYLEFLICSRDIFSEEFFFLDSEVFFFVFFFYRVVMIDYCFNLFLISIVLIFGCL